MKVQAIKTRVFKEGEDLIRFITENVRRPRERSVIVVTSKIVALAEKRTAVVKDEKEKEKLIRKESERAIPTKYVWLTVKDGTVMASAGIDESNANNKLVLLPKDSFKTAHQLRKVLRRRYELTHLGILITDSRTIPLRAGVTGMAIGYAGFCGIKDYENTPDLFGRKFVYTKTNIADGLAAAAVLTMGEGREQQPLAVIERAPIKFCDKIDPKEVRINLRDDMYRPFFMKLSKR